MKQGIASVQRIIKAAGIAQVADYLLAWHAFQIAQITGRPNQQSQIGTVFNEDPRHVTAQKPGGACYESKHLAVGTRQLAESRG